MEESNNLGKLAVRYGLFASLGLILYFVLMNVFGLLYIIELRFLNFVFLASMIVFGISRLQKEGEQGVGYFDGLSLGLGISLIATVTFTLFVYLFLGLNPDFVSYLIEHAPFGSFLNKTSLTLVLVFEGLSSGVIVTYTAMQFYKKQALVD